jgi:hypothetical protein
MKILQLVLLLLVVSVFTACGGGGSGTGNVTGTRVTAIAISPSVIELPRGMVQRYVVQATYSDGTTQAVAGAVFTSSSPTVAAVIDSSGLLSTASAGTSTITATYNGLTATATMNVLAATLQSISVTPASAGIPVGATQQFTATGNYSDGTTHPIAEASWTPTSPAVATVDSTGMASGVAVGNSNIIVAFCGKSTTVSLAVTTGTLQSIAVTPATASIVSGTKQQFIATGSYSDGTTHAIASPVWTSSLPGIASIDSTGLATAGAGAGSTDITATHGGKSATVPLAVTLATPISLTITTSQGEPTTMPLNTSVLLFNARINYSNGTSQPVSAAAVWSSSNTAVGTIWANWGINPVGVGSTTVTVTEAGVSGTIIITYTAPAPVSSSIVGLNTGINSFAKRVSVQLSAMINYSQGPAVAATSAAWSSSDTNVFTVDASGLFKGVGAGTATLTLTADGFVKTRNITLVNPVATPSIIVTCNSAAPMTLSAATWNAGYALDPKNATEWVTVDPVSCAAHPYVMLLVTSAPNRLYVTLEAHNYGGGVFGPGITNTSTLTPELSSGNTVTVGSNTTSPPSWSYTPVYSFAASP